MSMFDVPAGKTGAEVAKKAMFLAYEACGMSTGMGWLQARAEATEDDVWRNVVNHGDYPGSFRHGVVSPDAGEVYADYVYGRMMKVGIEWKDGKVIVPNRPTALDYQGWSHKYGTYDALIEAALKLA